MKIGISTRLSNNDTYKDTRDALSRDWTTFINDILPESILIPFLNHPKMVYNMINQLSFDACILSNGNDWGEDILRDETEAILINECIKNNIPLIGICRGLQVLNIFFQGIVEKNIQKKIHISHVSAEHNIVIVDKKFNHITDEQTFSVNSYHNNGVLLDGISKEFIPFAVANDIVVEGFYHQKLPLLAIQWHPERINNSYEFNKKLISTFFTQKDFWNKNNTD